MQIVHVNALLSGPAKRKVMAQVGSGQFATIGLHKDVHEALLAARAPEQNEEDYLSALDEEAVFVLLNEPNLNRALAHRVWQSMLESRYRFGAVQGANAPRLNDLDAVSQPDEWIHQSLTKQVVPEEDQLAQSCSRLSHLDNSRSRSESCWGSSSFRSSVQSSFHSSASSSWGVGSTGPFPSMWDIGPILDKQVWPENPERETTPQASNSSGPVKPGLWGFNQPHPHLPPFSSSHPSASLAPTSEPFSSNIWSHKAADDKPSEVDEVAACPPLPSI